MRKSLPKAVVVLMALLVLGACSSSGYHKYIMRGQVVQTTDDWVIVCIGREDGVEPGMTFVAFKSVYDGAIEDGTDNNYRLEKVGVIEVESLLDQHFAKARVIDGVVNQYDLVEFRN